MTTLTFSSHYTARNRLEGIGAGVAAGFFAGLVLSFYMLGMSLFQGQDIWMGAKMAGIPFLGEAAKEPGFALIPVLVGLASHFAVSIFWGALFGALVFRQSRGATLAWGALWGIVVWLGMFYAILPFVGLAEIANSMPLGAAIFEHVLFGLALAVGFLPFQPKSS